MVTEQALLRDHGAQASTRPLALNGATELASDTAAACSFSPADHRVLTAQVKMTGEASGRQTWAFAPGQGVNPPPFDASKNPNSSDLLFRSQRLDAWRGKDLPGPSKPATPQEVASPP